MANDIALRDSIEALPEKWSDEIAAMGSGHVCAAFRKEWAFASFHYWRAILMLSRIVEDASWSKEIMDGKVPRSPNEWILGQKLPGLMHPPTVSRILGVAKWFATLSVAERLRWVPFSVWDVVEVMPVVKQLGADKAFEIVSSNASARQKREEVRRNVATDQHLDVSGYRNLSVLMTKDDYEEFVRGLNAAKHQLEVADPPDSLALRFLSVEFLNNFEAQCARVEPLFDILGSAFREKLRLEMKDDVEAGKLICIECGSWVVQRHHCPPRSANIRRADGTGMWNPDDPEWPCVYLCPRCHQTVHLNLEGAWYELAERWKAKDERFARRYKAFIGDRNPNDI